MHQDDNPKFIDDLHERIDDSLASIRAVKARSSQTLCMLVSWGPML